MRRISSVWRYSIMSVQSYSFALGQLRNIVDELLYLWISIYLKKFYLRTTIVKTQLFCSSSLGNDFVWSRLCIKEWEGLNKGKLKCLCWKCILLALKQHELLELWKNLIALLDFFFCPMWIFLWLWKTQLFLLSCLVFSSRVNL